MAALTLTEKLEALFQFDTTLLEGLQMPPNMSPERRLDCLQRSASLQEKWLNIEKIHRENNSNSTVANRTITFDLSIVAPREPGKNE